MMDQIQERLLAEVADLHGVPEGAYNIRANGKMAGRSTQPTLILQLKQINRELILRSSREQSMKVSIFR